MVLKHITVLYHMMTVLLEYIDRSQHFSQMLNIAILHFPIMLNAFNDPLCSKLCWHNRRVPTKHSWMSDKTQKQTTANWSSLGNFQHWYLLELLVNMYSYHLMVKNVSCCHTVCAWKVAFLKSGHSLLQLATSVWLYQLQYYSN